MSIFFLTSPGNLAGKCLYCAVLPQKLDFEEGMGGKEGLCPCTVDGPDLHSLTMIQWAEEK